MRRTGIVFLVAVLIFGTAGAAMATNGMNMIGYNARASGMGGADVAIDTDCSGTACNPATLGRYRPRSAAIGLSSLMPQMSLENAANSDGVDGEDQLFPLPYLAYASRLGETSPWTLGFDLFAQGGMGVDFQGLNSGLGTTDEITSKVQYLRLTGSAAYRVNDSLSLGLGVMGGYAGMEFTLYPDTYSAAAGFGGLDASGIDGFGIAGRVGAHYKVNDMLSLGVQYTSEASLTLDGGDLTLNFGMGENNPQYTAEVENFTWPREVEFGVALSITPSFLLASDVKWINWSSAIDKVDLVVSDGPAGFEQPFQNGTSDTQVFDLNWDDQWVFAVGAEYQITPMHAVRAGYNYGKNPVPDANLSPLFPAIVEHHVTVGYGLILEKWAIDLAYEHAFNKDQTSTATQGAEALFNGTTVSHSQNTIHGAVTYFY